MILRYLDHLGVGMLKRRDSNWEDSAGLSKRSQA